MVVPASHPIPRVGWYSRWHPESSGFAYRALTVCGGPSQGPSAPHGFGHSVSSRVQRRDGRSTPWCHRAPAHSDTTVWAAPRSLAATRGISADFLADATEMFPFASRPSRRISPCQERGFPIRTARDQRMLGSSPARFGAVLRPSSASHRQGIPRLLCVSLRSSAPSLLRPLLCSLRVPSSLGKVLARTMPSEEGNCTVGGPFWARTRDLSLIRTAL